MPAAGVVVDPLSGGVVGVAHLDRLKPPALSGTEERQAREVRGSQCAERYETLRSRERRQNMTLHRLPNGTSDQLSERAVVACVRPPKGLEVLRPVPLV